MPKTLGTPRRDVASAHPATARALVLRLMLCADGALALIVGGPIAVAAADFERHVAHTRVGPGDSEQLLSWNQPEEGVRLKVWADAAMSNDHCIDAFYDWRTSDGTYSDGRVIRVRKRGGNEETDPGGDLTWREEGWQSRNPDGPQRAVSMLIDDDNYGGRSGDYVQKHTVPNIPGLVGVPNHPITRTDWFARVRTLYQDGSVDVSENSSKPYDCDVEDDGTFTC